MIKAGVDKEKRIKLRVTEPLTVMYWAEDTEDPDSIEDIIHSHTLQVGDIIYVSEGSGVIEIYEDEEGYERYFLYKGPWRGDETLKQSTTGDIDLKAAEQLINPKEDISRGDEKEYWNLLWETLPNEIMEWKKQDTTMSYSKVSDVIPIGDEEDTLNYSLIIELYQIDSSSIKRYPHIHPQPEDLPEGEKNYWLISGMGEVTYEYDTDQFLDEVEVINITGYLEEDSNTVLNYINKYLKMAERTYRTHIDTEKWKKIQVKSADINVNIESERKKYITELWESLQNIDLPDKWFHHPKDDRYAHNIIDWGNNKYPLNITIMLSSNVNEIYLVLYKFAQRTYEAKMHNFSFDLEEDTKMIAEGLQKVFDRADDYDFEHFDKESLKIWKTEEQKKKWEELAQKDIESEQK